MAKLKNYSGDTISIDDTEARRDIQHIRTAQAKINEICDAVEFRSLHIDKSRFAGFGADRINALLELMDKDLKDVNLQMHQTAQFVEQTITRYQQIDAEVARRAREAT